MFVLLRLLNGGSPWLWIGLGGVMAAGLLNKVSMLWFGMGLAVGLVLTPARRWLATPWPWAASLIGLAGLLPFVWWQAQHDWAFIEFNRNAALYKVGTVPLGDFAREQLLAMNATGAPLWIAGLIYAYASRSLRPYQPVAWIFVTTVVILAASGSARPHYLAPAFAAVFAPAAIAVERLGSRRVWITAIAAVALVVGGAGSAPVGLAVISPEHSIAYINRLGLRPREELDRGGVLPIHLALLFHANAILRSVQSVYEQLPPDERARVEILTSSFGEAGTINVLGPGTFRGELDKRRSVNNSSLSRLSARRSSRPSR